MDNKPSSQTNKCSLCGQDGFHEPCEIQIGDVREILQRIGRDQGTLRQMFGAKTNREGVAKAVALVNARGSKVEIERVR